MSTPATLAISSRRQSSSLRMPVYRILLKKRGVKAFFKTVSRHYLPLDMCCVVSVYHGFLQKNFHVAGEDTFISAAKWTVDGDACLSSISNVVYILISIVLNLYP